MHTTPTRRVVSKYFVQESIKRRKLVPYSELTLFVREDSSVVFHFHDSLEEDISDKFRKEILLRGGNPDGELGDAQVVIRRADWQWDKRLKAEFENIIRLETPDWLESCIQRNRFTLNVPVIKTQSSHYGRKPGAPRNEYTKQDDQFLVAWMATHFGYSMAGRAGNKAYQDMVEISEYFKYSAFHTWHSWRERYKNNKKRLDPLIEAYIEEHGTAQPGEGSDEEPEEKPPVIKRVQGAYKRPRGGKRRAKDDDGIESDGSHHSNESYRPEKEKRQEGEAGAEKRQNAPQKSTSSQARAKKRARVTTAAPEERVIKTSASQKVEPSSQKPLLRSRKPSSSSQKATASQDKAPSSSQKAPLASKKAAKSPKTPVQQASSPAPSSRHSSPADNPTPPRAPSPPPPKITHPTSQARLEPSQSMLTTTTEAAQEESQTSVMSSGETPEFPLDPALTSPRIQADVHRSKSVAGDLEELTLSGREEEEDEDEDMDVEVGGVSQYQRGEDEELSEDIQDELAEIAKEYNIAFHYVKGQFQGAQGEEADDVMEATRNAVKEMAGKLRG
ncbi:hypothetical protein FRC09_012820 [Ceratobasidium sp. 395]|nr:hypothetical protein FRC09_012820 [Ceratobasidium sp. 395]